MGLGDAAGHDAGEMRKVRRDVERNAVERRPAPHPDADRGDLVLRRRPSGPARLVGAGDPDADPVRARLACDVERLQRPDQPAFEGADISAHVGPAALEVEHDIGDALARPVIGEPPAAAGAKDRKARLDQVFGPGARSGGVEGRMLDEPDALRRRPAAMASSAGLHLRQRRLVAGQTRRDEPFDRRGTGRGEKRGALRQAGIGHERDPS